MTIVSTGFFFSSQVADYKQDDAGKPNKEAAECKQS